MNNFPGRDHSSAICFSSQNGDMQQPGNKKNRFFLALRNALTVMISSPRRIFSRVSRLSRRAKALLLVQVMIFTVIIGGVGRRAYLNGADTRGVRGPPVEVPYSSFLELCESPGSKGVHVDSVRIGSDRLVYRVTKEGTADEKDKQILAYTNKVAASPQLIDHLRENKITFSALPQKRANTVGLVLRTAVLGFYMLILWRMYKTFNGNSGSGDVPGKIAPPPGSVPLGSFNDIQGIDEAKGEVMELVDALRNPAKYAMFGARAPTGLLLEGPPGTGKTMLARATAATAGVPLLYCSGSDFVEMFVGRGAARVRKLFERAAKLSPCIIFVDELDALGKSRDSGSAFTGSRGNDEAEQTLNQLLACMDGLDSNKRICVLAATNRKEVLDPALIRPGRFDRIVTLKLPDAQGRENILRVHTRNLPGFKEGQGLDPKVLGSLGVGERVDLSAVAAATMGFSGAELEFLVNEAAIRAVRRVTNESRQNPEAPVVPRVRAEDFQASLENFYATRRSKSVGDVLKSVWGQ